jgi:NADPH:quinone reductase-like Zn-dependent oxidoreductase
MTDVLTLEEIDKPIVPDDGVLVRVHASSVNPADFFQLSRVAHIAGWIASRFKQKFVVLGTDFAGRVEAVGKSVTQFQPGDEVFGGKRGAFADYVCLPETGAIVRKPRAVTFEQAAAVPIAGVTALQAVRDHGRVQPGQKVLINGASGGVGTFAVQIAKCFGAHVTAVCSTKNVETARSLGADRVIDYTMEDFTSLGERYDLILDIAGNRSWSECKTILQPNGILVVIGGSSHTVNGAGRTLRHSLGTRLASVRGSQKVVIFIARMHKVDLGVLAALVESGRVRPIIDRRYQLNEVPDAFRYMAEGHAHGKIVILV